MIAVQHASLDDRIYFKQAKSLRQAGFDVSIVTANTHGKPLDMSGNSFEAGEDEFGILHSCVREPSGFLQRILKKVFKGKFYTDMIERASETGAKIFVAHEAQSILIARKAAEKNKGLYVFDAHESIHVSNPKDRWALRKEVSNLKYLTCANEITLKTLSVQMKAEKSEVIYNASLIPVSPVDKDLEPLILHEGSLPFNRGLRLMMEAMVILKEDTPDFRLKIVGSLKEVEKEYFDSMTRDHSLSENIEVTGWVDYQSLGDAISKGTIGLLLNTPEPNNIYGGPANKLFNYLASNMTVVAVDLPETTRILKETGAGITIQERDPQLLAKTLGHLIHDQQKCSNHRDAAFQSHQKYSWNNEAQKLTQFYEQVSSDLLQSS